MCIYIYINNLNDMHALGLDDFDLWNHSNQTKTDHQQRSIPLNMTFLALSGKRS